MQVSDRVSGAAAVDVVGPDGGALVHALQGLYLAFQKTSIYPPGHPSIPEVLETAGDGFAEVLADGDELTIGVSSDQLLCGGERLVEGTGAISSLAMLLHDLDVATLEVRSGIAVPELQMFVELLGEARRDGLKGGLLVDALSETQVEHLRIKPIDYSALQFSDGTREHPDEDDTAQVWENLSSSLTGNTPPAEAPTPEQMANAMNAEIDRREGTGVGVLRKKMQRLSRKTESATSDQRRRARERMAKFVAALNPKLRRDLSRFDPREPGESLSLLDELGDVLPETDLLDTLQQIDRAGSRLPSQLMTLMTKLMRVSHGRPSLETGLEDTMTSWGMSPKQTTMRGPELRAALEEVFQARSRIDCVPEPYQNLLQDLSRNQLEGEHVSSSERYRDPRDAEDRRLHTLEITVRLLSQPGGEEHRCGLFASVRQATDYLLRLRRLDLISDSAMAARTYSLLKTAPVETRKAANAYLEDFASESRVLRVLELICRSDEVPEIAISLLGLGGFRALSPVLASLSKELAPQVADRLARFVAQREPEELRRLMQLQMEREDVDLAAVLQVLRHARPADALELLDPLLEHESLEVRREATRLQCSMDDGSGRTERHLRRLLADEDKAVAELAIDCLSKMSSPRSLELLGCYAEGSLQGVTTRPGPALSAGRGLVARGEAGIERACDALETLCRRRRPSSARKAWRLAELLRELDNPLTTSALDHWRRSPARLIAMLFRTKTGRKRQVGE